MKKFRFGRAFLDEFAKVSVKSKHFKHKQNSFKAWDGNFLAGNLDENNPSDLNPWIKVAFLAVLIILFLVFFTRLFHLQVVEGSRNRELADSNRIKVKTIHAPRGVIYDRNGKLLAQNEPGFRLIEDATKNETGLLLRNNFRYLSRDEAVELEVRGDQRYEALEIDSLRSYPQAEKLAHVLGYVGEISAEGLKVPKFENYNPGDKIGRSGIEETYEKVLRGIDGGEIIEVDSTGKKVRTLRKKEAIPGQNLFLTIDADLQTQAYQKLSEMVNKSGVCCGALIAQDPKTGQILSLVSLPSFNPSDISKALVSQNEPLLNRSIAGAYPPGSTFKIASALAGLESGKVNAQTIIEDTGVINLGPFKFTNWYFTQYGRTEGPVDLIKALKRSNDTYFYRVGSWVGEKKLAETARLLGLGERLGIDIPGEEIGIIPDNDWKVKNIGDVWYPGDSLHMAIGQGFVLTTPLQVSHLISTIASGGRQYPPHLALKITSPNGKEIKKFEFDEIESHKFKDEYLKLIQKGLEEVPKNGGTAWPFFTFPFATAGKTGTAEFGDPKGATHAWYTAYAPVDDPSIVVTVLIEKGGEGSSVAAPVAKEILRWFLSNDKNNLLKDIYPISTESARTLGD